MDQAPGWNRLSRRTLMLVFLSGLLLSFLASLAVTWQMLSVQKGLALAQLEANLHGRIDPEVFTVPATASSAAAREALDAMHLPGLVRIKLWSAEGRLAYADPPAEEGGEAASAGLRRALGGQPVASFSLRGSHAGERLPGKGWLEVYLPYRQDGRVVGVVEAYLRADALGQAARRMALALWAVLLGGFLLLAVFLRRVLRVAGETMQRQDESLAALNRRLEETLADRERTYLGTIKSLQQALYARDRYTAGHSLRVAHFAAQLGQALGLPASQVNLVEEAGLLHDIGKIGIAEAVLNKPGRLTEREFREVRQHPVTGAAILRAHEAFQAHAQVVLHHHERYDGRGYPDGLSGQEIPLLSRILAVADTFDALTTDRPYHRAIPPARALEVLQEVAGSQLDPQVVEMWAKVWRCWEEHAPSAASGRREAGVV